MKKQLIVGVALIGLLGGSTFQYKTMPVAKESIKPGEGNTVTFKGKPLQLGGKEIHVGDRIPTTLLAANDLSETDLAGTRGKVRIISMVPSLDTPVCEQQTHTISEKNDGLDKDVQFITVSMDLPFAQKRFSQKAKIHSVVFLSDHRSAQFGENFGLLIKPLHLLSRAVLVVDRDNVIRYIQVVPEITALPDIHEAMKVAKGLL